MKQAVVAGLAVSLLVAGCSAEGSTKEAGPAGPEAAFKGKTITILAPFAPGGAADTAARLTAKELPHFLPGHPTIIVKNITGGGGSVAMNEVASKEPANGLTIASVTTGVVFRRLFEEPGHDYDLKNMPVIGALPSGVVTVVDKSKGGDITALRALSKPIVAGGTSAGSHAAITEALEAKMLGVPIKQVFGYDGYAPVALAMQSGEVGMSSPGDLSYAQTFKQYADKIVPVYQAGILDASGATVRTDLAPDTPTVDELLEENPSFARPSQQVVDAFKITIAVSTVGTSLVIRSGTPKAIVEAMQKAFTEMGNSQEWKDATTKSLTFPMETMDGTEAQTSLKSVLNSSESSIALLKSLGAE